ncbi:lysosomal dipeptide transporter MFSD1-like isoform X2 [Centruroides vittatus]
MGNRVGVFLFSLLCVLGSSIFALGTLLRGRNAMLPVMLLGRLLFGAGNGSLTVVQNRISAFWFAGKELALAFGMTLTFSRLGSVLNFFLTSHIYSKLGLTWTLWIGTLLCCVGLVSAVILSFLDRMGIKSLGQEENVAAQSKRMRFTDIRYFSLSFWLLTLTIMFFYNGVFPFVADASEFIQDKYNYNQDTASYIAGAVYDVSMVLSPFLGGIIDFVGKRGILAISSGALSIPVFALLAFTSVHPLVSTIWLGITYSIAAASMWPSIPLVVSQATIGTAMGFTTSLQMIGIGVSNLIVGEILGSSGKVPTSERLVRWKYVMIYLLINSLGCILTSTALNIIDRRTGGILNFSQQQLREILGISENMENEQSEENHEEEEADDNGPLIQKANNIIS